MGKNRSGVTLMELLVVVLIVGILTAVAVPQYRKMVTRAKNREAVLAIRAIGKGIEMYDLENGALPNRFNADSSDDPSFPIEQTWDFSKLSIQPPDSKNWQYFYFCLEGKRCFITANPKEEEEVGDISYWLSGRTDIQGHLEPRIYVNESELLERTTDPVTHETTSSSVSRAASAETCRLALGRMDPEKGCIID